MIKRQSTKPVDKTAPALAPALVAKRRAALLQWYRLAGRALPWRYPSDVQADPYRVWLSEIMLQQTTVVTVKPYFQKFIDLWPGVHDLAAADLDDLLRAWAGLGYYARARNLHKCAKVIVDELDGIFPDTVFELLKLPGIGTYTAAAIAAIAFGRPAVPVDGNVIRVLSRLHAVRDPMPANKAKIERLAEAYGQSQDAGDFAQSLIELGALVCRDRNPACDDCPLQDDCRARQLGPVTEFPVKVKKKSKPVRHGWFFWIEDGRGRVLLRRRPEKGLLGGMMELPGTDWAEEPLLPDVAAASAPFQGNYYPLGGTVKHTFTHFHLLLEGQKLTLPHPANLDENSRWVLIDDLATEALPTVMKKAVQMVLEQC